ncbi:hypothetical protein [Enterobacter sp. M4-VN]|uniref:hypothetical protein n=1 Tax=Enterobacter sp. M4-VN TaxID=2724127 RepID=UPI001484135F|nr:hypothetical protein [Enterobacter sp. M4-VN]GFM11971.1 hypothetical protein NCT2013_43890 [Enterobacter sp. M4-VN]HCM9506456.1 hypothetical protein [Enterobacter kobei]HCM9509648.1 hypothetical protein [Enterobacter kobei]
MEHNPLAGLVFIIWLITFFPCFRMAKKAGFGWAMAIFLSMPGLHFIMLWVFAFMKWPNLPNK